MRYQARTPEGELLAVEIGSKAQLSAWSLDGDIPQKRLRRRS
jgi:hypothetical protein